MHRSLWKNSNSVLTTHLTVLQQETVPWSDGPISHSTERGRSQVPRQLSDSPALNPLIWGSLSVLMCAQIIRTISIIYISASIILKHRIVEEEMK